MAKIDLHLDVLLLKEGDQYVAQCLQHDITAQGTSIDEVRLNLERTLVGQIYVDIEAGLDEPITWIATAPKRYWEAYRKGEKLGDEYPFYLPARISAQIGIGQEVSLPAFMIEGARGTFKFHTGRDLW
jgi:hypothetical protein